MRRSGLTQPTLAGSAVLPGQAGGSVGSGRAAGAALTALAGLTAGAACPTVAAVPTFAACPAVTAGSALPAGAVAAGRRTDNGTQVDEAADSIEDGAGVGGHRGQRRSHKRDGSRTKTDQLTTPARFGVIRPAIPFGKALTSH
jgi:hypothetical protein